MKTYNNLWEIPNSNEKPDLTDSIKDIMKQQSEYLKDTTNNKVFGKFARIKKTDLFPGLTAGALAISSMLSSKETFSNETDNLKDANILYTEDRYGYEIYNSTYRFRMFEMNITPIYPIQIIIDEGIMDDISKEISYNLERGDSQNHIILNNDNDLIDCLKLMFTSKKVKYLIYRLLQNSK